MNRCGTRFPDSYNLGQGVTNTLGETSGTSKMRFGGFYSFSVNLQGF